MSNFDTNLTTYFTMAKKKKSNKENFSATQKLEIGVGLTAAAVAAAGAYFLYGSKHAAQNRQKVKSWMLKAKAEVLERLEEVREISWDDYQKLIDEVAASYAQVKNASKADIKAFREEMMAHWKNIEKVGKPKKKSASTKRAKTATKKSTKKSSKKVAKKAAKK